MISAKPKIGFYLLIITAVLLTSLIINGCGKKLPDDRAITGGPYKLINQDSSTVNFPGDFKGSTVLMTFIYTHCPDICPLTTHNMQMIEDKLKSDGVKNIKFIELSFDPDRDTPSVLRDYGDIRSVNFEKFSFLTGEKSVVDTLLHHMEVIAIPSDTTYTDDGTPVYYFTHTDRITLIDKDGHIRNEYRGSKAPIDEIVKDVKILGD